MPKNLRMQAMLMALSLLIAFVVWLIAKSGEVGTDWLTTPLLIGNEIENVSVTPNRREIAINVQFPLDIRSLVTSKNFRAEIDVRKYFSGDPEQWPDPTQPRTEQVRLRAGETILPGAQLKSVEILGMDPGVITLEARLLTRELTVDVRTTGTLPSYYELTGGQLAPDPPVVRVTGSLNALEALNTQQNKIATKRIDLSLITQSGPVFPELVVPEGVRLFNNRDGRIRVDVGLSEVVGTETITQVPVEIIVIDDTLLAIPDPAVVGVVVRGPLTVVEKLSVDQFDVTVATELNEAPGARQEVGLRASLASSVGFAVAGRVTVLEVQPPRITVEFVRRNPEDVEDPTTGTQESELPSE